MAVAFLNTNTMQVAIASPVSDTTNMSVTASGTNRCAFALIAYDNAAGMSVTSVSYGGQAMTKCGAASHDSGTQSYAEIWSLVNPPTGLNTLAIAVAGTIQDIYYNLVAFTGVNQTTPVRAGSYQSGTNQTTDGAGHISLVIPSNTNDITISVINGDGGTITATNQTTTGSNSGGGYNAFSDRCTTPASSVTHTYTGNASTGCAAAGLSINGDPAGGGGWVDSGTRRAPAKAGPFDQRGMLLSPFQQYSYVPVAAVAATILQRKTLSPLGTHTGGRQSQ